MREEGTKGLVEEDKRTLGELLEVVRGTMEEDEGILGEHPEVVVGIARTERRRSRIQTAPGPESGSGEEEP